MDEELDSLEAVFYCSPIPYNLTVLTYLGLVFDRVYFPNVYIPTSDFDPEELQKEINRIADTRLEDYNTRLLLALMTYTLLPELREFCCFTGVHGQVFGGEHLDKAKDLAFALEQQIHGPPKPGFTPMFETGHHKAISENQYIDYPGQYYYQCNALLYAARHGIPLLNSDPKIPVPAIGGETAKNNAKLLSSIIAMECVNMALPEIGALQPRQILEAREELATYVKPFRLSMLRLSSQLNQSIESDSSSGEIVAAAKFVVDTEVYPSLMELKNELAKPRKGWLSRSWDLTKKLPQLAVSYAALNREEALPKTVEALGDWIVAGTSQGSPRSDFYYLLKLEEVAKKR